MSLQNRMSPWGSIVAASTRGLFTGNRGIIHDPETKTLLRRRWTTKAWIICVCSFKERRRDVMGYNGRNGKAGWTELFFLDEVTALAAGHRPCFYCQRERAQAFLRCFASGQGRGGIAAPEMDTVLHRERRASGGTGVQVAPAALAELPEGTMIERHGEAYAWRRGRLLPWRFEGYGAEQKPNEVDGAFVLLTPPATVAALRQGFTPVWHPSAGS